MNCRTNNYFRSLLLGLLVGFSYFASGGFPPYVAAPSEHPLHSARGRHGRSDIEVEDGLAGGLWLAAVVVDDIAYFLRVAVGVPGDVPVVTVEGRLRSTVFFVSYYDPKNSQSHLKKGTRCNFLPKFGRIQPTHDLQHGSLGSEILGAALEAHQSRFSRHRGAGPPVYHAL